MCITPDKKIYTATEDFIAYKIVSKLIRQSQWYDHCRGDRTYWKWMSAWFDKIPFVRGTGETRVYQRGTTRRSYWPGLYCFVDLKGAEYNVHRGNRLPNQIIEVGIPKGTDFVEGDYYGVRVLCTRKLVVLT